MLIKGRNILINFEGTEGTVVQNTKVYRYYKMYDFLSSLRDQCLFLKKPYLWNDPFENLFFNSKIIDTNGEKVSLEIMKEQIYSQCWTLKEESNLMWNNFVSDGKGVKVTTTIGKIIDVIINLNLAFMGKVGYFDESEIRTYYSKPILNNIDLHSGLILKSLLTKRKEFSDEQEIRIIYFNFFKQENLNRQIFTLNRNANEFKNDFTMVSIDPNKFFDEIVFHPRIKVSESDSYKINFKDLGYNGIVKMSKLYDLPDITITFDNSHS